MKKTCGGATHLALIRPSPPGLGHQALEAISRQIPISRMRRHTCLREGGNCNSTRRTRVTVIYQGDCSSNHLTRVWRWMARTVTLLVWPGDRDEWHKRLLYSCDARNGEAVMETGRQEVMNYVVAMWDRDRYTRVTSHYVPLRRSARQMSLVKLRTSRVQYDSTGWRKLVIRFQNNR